jgi:hypothetical protein
MGCLVAFSAVGNYAVLRSGSLSLQDTATHVRAELGALEVAGTSVDPNYVPDQARTQGVRAAPYLAVVRAHGSPSDTAGEIARQGEPIRLEADAVLEHALGVTVTPVSALQAAGPPLPLVATSGGTVGRRRGCIVFRPRTPGALVEVVLPAAGATVAPKGGAVAFSTRHFAAGYGQQPLGTVSRTSVIRVGRARAPLVWYLQVKASEPLRACSAGGGGA